MIPKYLGIWEYAIDVEDGELSERCVNGKCRRFWLFGSFSSVDQAEWSKLSWGKIGAKIEFMLFKYAIDWLARLESYFSMWVQYIILYYVGMYGRDSASDHISCISQRDFALLNKRWAKCERERVKISVYK